MDLDKLLASMTCEERGYIHSKLLQEFGWPTPGQDDIGPDGYVYSPGSDAASEAAFPMAYAKKAYLSQNPPSRILAVKALRQCSPDIGLQEAWHKINRWIDEGKL